MNFETAIGDSVDLSGELGLGRHSFFSVVETNVIFIESLSHFGDGMSGAGWFMGDRLAKEPEFGQVRDVSGGGGIYAGIARS